MPEEVLLSALNHFLYCPRRFGLIHVEGIFRENAFTVEGALRHESADTPGYESKPGVRVVRALPVFSWELGIQGKADIVEFQGGVPYPVEYKRGKRKAWDNDDVQVCAQALCLEEMFHRAVPFGAVFHAASRRRREVRMTESLREHTRQTIAAVRKMLAERKVPKAILKPQCEGCSMRPDCLPELDEALVRRAARSVWEKEV